MSKDKGGKSKKKMIIILAALVVAVVGGGLGGYFLFAPKSAEVEPPPEPGSVVKLDPITINLADGHYLKLGIALQATAEVAEEPDGSKALDLAIDLYSNRSVGELSSNDERNRLKKELTERVEKAYEKEIMDVYLTEFVMQ